MYELRDQNGNVMNMNGAVNGSARSYTLATLSQGILLTELTFCAKLQQKLIGVLKGVFSKLSEQA